MKVIIKSTNIDLPATIREYISSRIASIERILSAKECSVAQARVEIGRPSMHHRKGDVAYAEINLSIGRRLYRSSAEDRDIRTALDRARDGIRGQVRKYKTRLQIRRRKNKLMRK